MITLPLSTRRCDSCTLAGGCGVVQCPRCGAVRWLTDWEVYDDFAVCPADGCVVSGYNHMPTPETAEFVELSRYLQPAGPPAELVAAFAAKLPASPHYLLCRRDVDERAAAEPPVENQGVLF